MALVPCSVGGLKSSIVGTPIFPDPFRHDLLPGQQSALLQTEQVVAGSPSGSPITFYEWMNPVESPQRVGRNHRRSIQNLPILMDYRKESIHLIGDILEVGREVVPHVDWLLAVTSSKLRNISDGRVIQSPKCVFVEKLNSLRQTNVDAIRQQVILSQEVLLLNSRVKLGVVFFPDGHLESARGQAFTHFRSLICVDADRTLSFVISVEFGALPKAKLTLCSRNSSSVTTLPREASRRRINSGSGAGTF